METIVPYKEEFKKYIPEQYKNSEKLLALVNSCMAQFDDLETAFFEILQALNIADAIGPALDYLGAIVGVKRNPGESDTQYRERIVSGLNLLNLPGPEALRMVIKFLTDVDSVGLFPNWPAEMYYVLDGGTDANLSNLEKNSMTSGASLVRGTFLCAEEGEGGYIVNDDNGMPFVVDYLDIMDIPDNVFRFTFSKLDYDPTVAGVGTHGTWTKVESINQNEWDWTTEGVSTSGEFKNAFHDSANLVSVRCKVFESSLNAYELFYNNSSLINADLQNVSGIYGSAISFFEGCTNLKNIVLTGANNIETTSYFAGYCSNLESIYIDSLENCVSLNAAFTNCTQLKDVRIGNIPNVINLYTTFRNCSNLESVYLDIPSVTTCYQAFYGCSKLKNVVLKNTGNVENLNGSFSQCVALETAPDLDTSSCTNFNSLFFNCESLKEVPVYETSNGTDFNSAFKQCENLEYIRIDVSSALSIESMLEDCTSLRNVEFIGNTGNVENFKQLFSNCSSLKNLPFFDTSSAVDVTRMFNGCLNVEFGSVEMYEQMGASVSISNHVDCFTNCGINTISGIGDLTKIPTSWGGLGAIPANSLLFNFGDSNYNPNETTTSNHGTWTSYSTGYADNTFNLWLWIYDGNEYGWAKEFMPNNFSSYLSDFDNNPVDVVAHGDLTDIKCYADLFCRASALRYCCDFVIPDASVNFPDYSGSLQGMFSRCDNLEVFPHIDITNLKGGIFFIADNCTKLTTINPPTIRSIVGNDIDARNAFENCPNVEHGAAETYAVLKNITYDATDCFTNCGVNKLTGVSDLFKIPANWGGLGLVSEKAIVFAFGDENFNPSTAGVGAGGTWTALADNPTDFNIWTWTKSSNDWSGEFENAFTDEGNKPYILAIGSTGSVSNVDNFLKGSTYVRHGALDMYRQMSGQATPPSNHEKTFHDCGKLTEQGLFELLQIPVNWGGDVLTFCIENNLVAYLPDENQTEVLVQSIRYYQDVFRMMKNSDL
ncbi:BspA family leucine-rich repeat surface protein [Fibrobacter succinogenes]|uniref:BspA family leucine-rich repeat surface protein n=1 Tax=Fibrobacter succinogenes TaxID=833 RepID=UPI00156A21F4|nr:BspA family leucine-rich repeat surface protein [Fibrobacter succinogenes]